MATQKHRFRIDDTDILVIVSAEVKRVWGHALGQTVDIQWGTAVDQDLAQAILATVRARLT